MRLRLLAIVTALGALCVPFLFSQSPQEKDAESHAALMGKYCLTCHNNRLKTGGMTLESLDLRHPAAGNDAALETWEKVVRKVRVGMMPPQGAPAPTQAERGALVAWVEGELDHAAAERPHPGSVGVHRMNRAEYANAIRDLLDLKIDAASLLPPDDSTFGFDNIAETLGASPALVEQYLSAAGTIASLAVGDPGTGPAAEVIRVRQDASQNVPIEGLPVGTEGGVLVHTTLPLDGEYRLDIKYMISNLGAMKGLEMEHDVEIAVDGKRVHYGDHRRPSGLHRADAQYLRGAANGGGAQFDAHASQGRTARHQRCLRLSWNAGRLHSLAAFYPQFAGQPGCDRASAYRDADHYRAV